MGLSPDSVAHCCTLGKLLNASSFSTFKMGRELPKRSLIFLLHDSTPSASYLLSSPWMLPCPTLMCDLSLFCLSEPQLPNLYNGWGNDYQTELLRGFSERTHVNGLAFHKSPMLAQYLLFLSHLGPDRVTSMDILNLEFTYQVLRFVRLWKQMWALGQNAWALKSYSAIC